MQSLESCVLLEFSVRIISSKFVSSRLKKKKYLNLSKSLLDTVNDWQGVAGGENHFKTDERAGQL